MPIAALIAAEALNGYKPRRGDSQRK